MDPASSLSHAANVAADPAAAPTADKRSVLYDLIDFFLEGGIQIWGLITGKRIREADFPGCPHGERGCCAGIPVSRGRSCREQLAGGAGQRKLGRRVDGALSFRRKPDSDRRITVEVYN